MKSFYPIFFTTFCLWTYLTYPTFASNQNAVVTQDNAVELTPQPFTEINMSSIMGRLLGFSLAMIEEQNRIPSDRDLTTMTRIFLETLPLRTTRLFIGDSQQVGLFVSYAFDLDQTDIEFLQEVRLFLEETRATTGQFPTKSEMERKIFDLSPEGDKFKFASEVNRNGFSTYNLANMTEDEFNELIFYKLAKEYLPFSDRIFSSIMDATFRDHGHYIIVSSHYTPEDATYTHEFSFGTIISSLESTDFISLLESLQKKVLDIPQASFSQ